MLGEHKGRCLVIEIGIHSSEPGAHCRGRFVLQEQLRDLKSIAKPALRLRVGNPLAASPLAHRLDVAQPGNHRDQSLAKHILERAHQRPQLQTRRKPMDGLLIRRVHSTLLAGQRTVPNCVQYTPLNMLLQTPPNQDKFGKGHEKPVINDVSYGKSLKRGQMASRTLLWTHPRQSERAPTMGALKVAQSRPGYGGVKPL